MPESKTKDGRSRNYATVVYPESAPADWIDRLASFVIPCYVSPLHDSDVNPTGEPKKEHYHVLFCFEGKKSKEQISQIVETIGGVGCESVNSLRGYARYLCHLDNPEKHQYSIDDVKSFGGADYITAINLVTDKYKCIKEMIDYCKTNKVYVYADLLEYCSENRSDWFRVLCDNGTVVMKEYLKSAHWKMTSYDKKHEELFNRKFSKE